MTSVWHATSWCPASVIFNSRFFPLLSYYRTSTAYSYLAGAPGQFTYFLVHYVATRTILVRYVATRTILVHYVTTHTILVRYVTTRTFLVCYAYLFNPLWQHAYFFSPLVSTRILI
jgi:hypothetical protein